MLFNRLHLKYVITAVLACSLLYTVCGFLVIPVFVKRTLENYVRESSGLELRIGHIDVNPFTLALGLSDTTLVDPEKQPILILDRVYINFDISGLLRRTLVIRNLDVQRPQLNIMYHGAGLTNLAPIFSKKTPDSGQESAVPAVLVKNVNLSHGSLRISDTRHTPELYTFLKEISFNAFNVSTQGEESGYYELAIDDAAQGKIRVTGDLNVPALSTKGSFKFTGIEIGNLYPWFKDRIELGDAGGRINIGADYIITGSDGKFSLLLNKTRLDAENIRAQPGTTATIRAQHIGLDFDTDIESAGATLRFAVTKLALRADDVELDNIDASEPLLSLNQISLSGGSLDWQDRKVHLYDLSIKGGNALYTRAESGRSDWSGIIDKIPNPETDADAAPPWVLLAERITTDGLNFKIVDNSPGEPVELTLSDIEIQASNLNTAPQQRGDYTFNMTVNQSGKMQGKGWLSPGEREIQATINLTDLDLGKLIPYLGTVTVLKLQSGTLSAKLNARYQRDSFNINGQLGGRDLVLVDAANGDTELSLDAMTATGVTLNGLPLVASIETIMLQHPYAKIEIDSDRNLNLSSWFKPLDKKDTPAAVNKDEQGQEVTLEVNRVGVKGGKVNFSDFSLSPQFKIIMADMAGSLNGVSLDRKRTVSMDLQGRVNQFGSAGITGRLRPFDPTRYSEVEMIIRNIDTSVLSPYSARFAGREIQSGKLNLDLKYLIKDGKLDGNHDIDLVNLVLGKRVESPDAQDLPLDMAIALLKDRDGKISISIPVTGTLDNPDFNIRKVVAAALGKLVSSIVAAPFKLLGSLIGRNGEQMNAIPFDPGSALITPPAQEAITELSEAFQKRPGLALRVVGSYDPVVDRDTMARRKLHMQISQNIGLSPEDPSEQGSIAFSDPDIQNVIEELALSRLGKEKLAQITDNFRKEKAGTGQGDTDVDQETYYEQVFNALVKAEEIPRAGLEQLAHHRAQSIADQLAGIGVEKVRVITDDQVKTTKGRARQVFVELAAEPIK